MPVARLWRRMNDAREQLETEARQDAERWLLSTWAAVNGNFHALRFGDETPPTRQEHEKRKEAEKSGKEPPINWQEVEASRQAMLDSKENLIYALQGPSYFAEWLGARGILEEPDETLEQFRARRAEEEKLAGEAKKGEAKAVEGRVISLLERLEVDAPNAPGPPEDAG